MPNNVENYMPNNVEINSDVCDLGNYFAWFLGRYFA
jgi:hypothetical protein